LSFWGVKGRFSFQDGVPGVSDGVPGGMQSNLNRLTSAAIISKMKPTTKFSVAFAKLLN
jgi:hypothetical protein